MLHPLFEVPIYVPIHIPIRCGFPLDVAERPDDFVVEETLS